MNAEKYAQLGGIRKVAEDVISGVTTVRAVASSISVSRQLVAVDIQQYFGPTEYKSLMQQRRMNAVQARKPIIVDVEEALKVLPKFPMPNAKSEDLSYWIPIFLKETRRHGIKLKFKFSKDCLPVLLTASGEPISLRTAQPTGKTPENKMGLHRFKISPLAAAKREIRISIFAIRSTEPILYLFKADEIRSLRSLVLRYSKFQRKSKYSKGLANWSLLKSVSR